MAPRPGNESAEINLLSRPKTLETRENVMKAQRCLILYQSPQRIFIGVVPQDETDVVAVHLRECLYTFRDPSASASPSNAMNQRLKRREHRHMRGTRA